MKSTHALAGHQSPYVDLIYFDAGGGHRAAATALKEVIAQQQRPWQVRLVNLREVLEPVDFIHRFTGVQVENFYNGILKHGLTIGIGPMLPMMHILIGRLHSQMVDLLARYWRDSRPDLVVSLIPHFNRAIFAGLRAADYGRCRLTPMATILTDLADYPPHFWIEPQEQYFICGSAVAVQQAIAMGHSSARVLRTSGMIVRPEFYQRPVLCLERERCRLGLRPDLPTGMVMFGGFGSRRMLTIAKRVAEARLETQLIFLCGRNDTLRRRLKRMELPFPHYVHGFTREVPYFMRLAHFLIGKPGPGSISEALVMGLPVIVEQNASTMVQERYNTGWILQNRFGLVLRSFAETEKGIAAMLDFEQMAGFRACIKALNNRAVFEIPEMLQGLIAQQDQSESYAFQA